MRSIHLKNFLIEFYILLIPVKSKKKTYIFNLLIRVNISKNNTTQWALLRSRV